MTLNDLMEILDEAIESAEDRGHDPMSYKLTNLDPSQILFDHDDNQVVFPVESVRVFANAILHGNEEHRGWLLEAAENFIEDAEIRERRG